MSFQETTTFRAILNIVFALRVQYDKQLPAKQRVTTADTFIRDHSASCLPIPSIILHDHMSSYTYSWLSTCILPHMRTAVGIW
jgi:hypothetical protein